MAAVHRPEPDAPLRPGSRRAAHEDSPLGIDRNVRLAVSVDRIHHRRDFEPDRRRGGTLRPEGEAAADLQKRANRGKSKMHAYFLDSHADLPKPGWFQSFLLLIVCGQTLERLLSESLGLRDSHRLVFFATNTDSEKRVALEHVKRAGDWIAHPVGFLPEPGDGTRLAQLLFALLFGFLRGFRFADRRFVFFFLRLVGWMELLSPILARGKRGGLGRI